MWALNDAHAETTTLPGGADAPVPAASQIIATFNEFNAFQQAASERTASLDRADLASTAAVRAEAAARRSRRLVDIERKAGPTAPEPSKHALGRQTMTTDSGPGDGPSFVRRLYAAQAAEYERTIAILDHYLQAPDNDDLRQFVETALDDLRKENLDVQSALGTK